MTKSSETTSSVQDEDDILEDKKKQQANKKKPNQQTQQVKKEQVKETESQKDENLHVGSLKWGKYKKKEKVTGGSKKQVVSEFDQGQTQGLDKKEKENFAFPDGGWVCSQC